MCRCPTRFPRYLLPRLPAGALARGALRQQTDDSPAFLDAVDAVDRHRGGRELLDQAAWPADLELVDAGGRAQAEVQPGRALALEAVAAVDLADEALAAGAQGDAGADGVAVRLHAGELQLDPVAGAGGAVVVEQRGLVAVGLEEVLQAVVVEVGDTDPAAVEVVV